jgi:hypothetical protein
MPNSAPEPLPIGLSPAQADGTACACAGVIDELRTEVAGLHARVSAHMTALSIATGIISPRPTRLRVVTGSARPAEPHRPGSLMTEHPMTFEAADGLNPYDLATRWGDRLRWLPETRDNALEELSTMAALRSCLARWLPTQIHSARMAGSAVSEVFAAANLTADEVSLSWHRWARVQRGLVIGTRTSLAESDYNRVAAVLAGANGTAETTG